MYPTQLKNKIQQLRTAVEIAEKVHNREKAKYCQMGDTCLRLRGQLDGVDGQQHGGAFRIKMVIIIIIHVPYSGYISRVHIIRSMIHVYTVTHCFHAQYHLCLQNN